MRRTLSVLLLACFIAPAWCFEAKPIDERVYAALRNDYGRNVEHRLRELIALLIQEKARPLRESIVDINDFFNRVRWRDDQTYWGKKDYWQTPLETLISFAGDCEDIAIAKYVALRTLGVPDDRLAIAYVRITREPEFSAAPHMVLAYYEEPGAEPLILDSIDKAVKANGQRKDIESVYEFNETTLWLTDHHLHKLGVGVDVSNLPLANEIKARLSRNREQFLKLNRGTPFHP